MRKARFYETDASFCRETQAAFVAVSSVLSPQINRRKDVPRGGFLFNLYYFFFYFTIWNRIFALNRSPSTETRNCAPGMTARLWAVDSLRQQQAALSAKEMCSLRNPCPVPEESPGFPSTPAPRRNAPAPAGTAATDLRRAVPAQRGSGPPRSSGGRRRVW